jgi:hypothetical protein
MEGACVEGKVGGKVGSSRLWDGIVGAVHITPS